MENRKIKNVFEKKLEDVKDRKPSEYWKRAAQIMMIRIGYQNADIMIAVECSVNTVKTKRCDADICNGDYVAVASKKGYSKCSNCTYTPEILQQLHDKMTENSS